MLIVSMVHSAYELNYLIPNIELLLYRMFCSPINTREARKGKDKDDLLMGNIFAEKNVSMTNSGYRSLLETLALEPKKKHYKKIVKHI